MHCKELDAMVSPTSSSARAELPNAVADHEPAVAGRQSVVADSAHILEGYIQSNPAHSTGSGDSNVRESPLFVVERTPPTVPVATTPHATADPPPIDQTTVVTGHRFISGSVSHSHLNCALRTAFRSMAECDFYRTPVAAGRQSYVEGPSLL